MIYNLPSIYKDELIYSVIGRYSSYSGNTNLRFTLKDVFNTIDIIPTIEFQSHLKEFIKNLNGKIDININDIIENNTLLPLYSCFTRRKKINKIKKIMISSDGKSIKYKIGMMRNTICKKDYINYCPVCSKEEFSEYGEAYIHRTHQVQGVFVCEKHGCLLKPYVVNSKRQEYICFDKESMFFDINYPKDENKEKLLRIAQDVYFILNNNVAYFIDEIKDKYDYLMYRKGLTNRKGRVNQVELQSQFLNHYGNEFLKILESDLEEDYKFNWLNNIVRKHNKTFHPLRHILLIDFLCGNVEKFVSLIKVHVKSDIERPWLCLNPCCTNYRKPVIKDCKIITDCKSKGTIGIFKCDCGFIYSRKITGDLMHIGRVRSYGDVWEAKLKELVNTNISIRAIAREMHCDPGTVVKYSEKLGIRNLLNTNRKILNKIDKNFKNKEDLRNQYRKEIIEIIALEPDIIRNNIRKRLTRQYLWSLKHDRKWLEDNLPDKSKRNTNTIDYSDYWNDKDNKTLRLVKEAYNSLKNNIKPIRITKSLIGTRIHKRALITMQLDKMPNTKEFLESVCESIEEFRFRRLDVIYEYVYKNEVELPEWKILKMASIKDKLILQKYKVSRTKV